MNGKVATILRQGAEKYNLPYNTLKQAYKKLNKKDRAKFLLNARITLHVRH